MSYHSTSLGMFKGVDSLRYLTFEGPISIIQQEAFYNCSHLTTITINSRIVLQRGVLNFRQTYVQDILSDSFFNVYIVQIILSREFLSPWDFPFQNHYNLQIINIDAPLTQLVTDMFSGCSSLSEIISDNEVILYYGELNLMNLHLKNSNVTGVFNDVPVDTVVLDDRIQHSQEFFNCLSKVETVFYHGNFPQPWGIPEIIHYFSNVKTINMRGYEIMNNYMIDISHAPITEIEEYAFSKLPCTLR